MTKHLISYNTANARFKNVGYTPAETHGFYEAPIVKTYVLETSAPAAFYVNNLKAKTLSGTLTLTVKIAGVSVTGLTSLSITSTKTTFTATALNHVTVGDSLSIVVTAISAPVDLSFSFDLSRTQEEIA